MKRPITFPLTQGITSRQAHCDLPQGTYEREFGREGFFGPCSHLYHANPPTGWVKWDGPLKPRAFDMTKISPSSPAGEGWGGGPLRSAPSSPPHPNHSQRSSFHEEPPLVPQGGRANTPWNALPVFHNAHMQFRYWQTSGRMDHLVTNGDGDELLFVHAGEGDLYTDFGHLAFREGDYITLPRGLKWRVDCKGQAKFLMIEATNSGYDLPDKGLVGPHAIFDPAMLDVPQINDHFKAQQGKGEWNTVIKRRNQFTHVTFPYNPLDAIGWKGDLCPVRINWRDIRPLMSHRYHLPPSAHTTFVANRFVVCTFAPRPMETDEGALKLPFFHSNNDFDEILFYHQGQFFSRDNIHPGMITLHPGGFAHGPHPKAFKLATESTQHVRKETDEVAVMVDTRDEVLVSAEAEKTEWTGYVDSWQGAS